MLSVKNYLLFLLLVVQIQVFGQQNHFRHFGLEDGLPQSQVFDVHQDSRGFIWIGTRGGGIARFDGQNFKTYNTKQGLINNFVNCIYEDSSGDLWIGTRTGLSRYNGLEFVNYPLSEGGDVRVFCVDMVDSSLLIGTSNGLFTLMNNTISPVTGLDTNSSFYVNDIKQYNNQVYVGTNRGMYVLQKGSWNVIELVNRKDGLPDDYIQTLEVDSFGVWIGTYGKGIRYYTNNEVTRPYLPIPNSTVCYDLKRTDDNKLWIATQAHGAFLYDLAQKKLIHYTLSNGLANNHVRCIEKDNWGNIWLGTSGGGLNQFAGQQFNHLTKKEGLADNYIYSAYQDLQGVLWIGTGKKGIVKRDSIGFVNYGQDSGFANVKVKAICQGTDSTMWLGTEGSGLGYYKNGSFNWLTVRDGLCGNYIKDIECTPDGKIWVATLDGGISEIIQTPNGYKFKNYRYLTQIPSNRIYALSSDNKGNVWFGTENKGLGKISNGKAQVVVSDVDLSYYNIRAIRCQGDLVWLATSGGLMRYDTKTKELVKLVEEELKSNNIYLLEFDHQKNLYVGHERGLEKLKVNETGDVIEVDFYGASEGFLGIETCQNASFCDQQGNLWFGTINGLTKYNPNALEINTTEPRIWLDNIDLFYEKLGANRFEYHPTSWNKLDGQPLFPYDQNHLSFSFVGIDLNSPTKLKYQWKLEGFDDQWVKPTSRRDAIYSNLPPGEYALKYRSVTSQGIYSKENTWPFMIHAPFWQMWWFKLLTWAVPFLIVAIFIVVYIQRIKKRGRREREKLMVEKELIELEQKALRLQMNPHFLFNALNSIQSLVALENHQDARKYLQKFAKLMRLTLQNSRVESIALSDEILTLSNYMELEQLTKNPAFAYEIEVGENLDPEEVYIPPMMLQPFVENAIKHGLPDLGADGQLRVFFDQSADKLICRITDNGIGRQAAEEKVKGKIKSHESAAIQVITDRLNIRNKEHEGNALEIRDLERGTEVVVTLVVG